MRWLVLLILIEASCIYSRGSLETGKHGYKNYPGSVAEEHARRRTRRRHALIAAPIEIVGGIAITALAIYGKSAPSDNPSGSVTSGLADAGKEIVGRLVLAGAGSAIAFSGVGDGLLGATDPLFGSPLVRHGELIGADRIDLIAPTRAPHLDVTTNQVLSLHGAEFGTGVGLGHWISDSVALRESVIGEFRQGFSEHGLRGGVLGELEVERAFGREHAGLYPRRALGLYGGGGYTWAARHDAPLIRAGVSFASSFQQYRLGVSQLLGVERPVIELGIRIVLQND